MSKRQNTFARINAYYDRFDEWSRLDSAAGIIEKGEVLHLVLSCIPSGSHILDLGSGPGRYAAEFIRSGYRVTLFDLSERLINLAREKLEELQMLSSIGNFHVGNATNLRVFPDCVFDAVFACGPFYHLVEAADRRAAALETMRVCKPGGTIMAGFIPRFSGLAGLLGRAARTKGQVNAAVFQDVVDIGVFQNAGASGFQEGYYPTVTEARALWNQAGLEEIKVFSTRSFVHQNEDNLLAIRRSDPILFNAVIQAHRKLASSDPFIEAGGHALLIGKKGKS